MFLPTVDSKYWNMVCLLALVWGWRLVMFQLYGFYCKGPKYPNTGCLGFLFCMVLGTYFTCGYLGPWVFDSGELSRCPK